MQHAHEWLFLVERISRLSRYSSVHISTSENLIYYLHPVFQRLLSIMHSDVIGKFPPRPQRNVSIVVLLLFCACA